MSTALRRRLLVTAALTGLVAAGCALGPTAAGRAALSQGRPAEAAEHFQEALTEHPGQPDALIGLGVSRYRLGDYPGAIATLADAAAKAPADPGARLYLALAHLRRGEDAVAAEQLTALRGLALHPRFAVHVGRTIDLLRGPRLPDDVRAYVAADLEDAAGWSREVAEARQALTHAQFAYDPFFYRPHYLIRCRRC